MDEPDIVIPDHLKPKDGRFGSGPTKVPEEHVERLAEFLGGELSDREKAQGLRNLLEVELHGAREHREGQQPETSYVNGRIAGYEFVLDAIDRRWPDLERVTISWCSGDGRVD